MAHLELVFMFLTIAGSILGGMSIYWVRSEHPLARLGRRLFVGTLLAFGGIGAVAAMLHAEALLPAGLLAGFLVIGMLWETPAPALQSVRDY